LKQLHSNLDTIGNIGKLEEVHSDLGKSRV